MTVLLLLLLLMMMTVVMMMRRRCWGRNAYAREGNQAAAAGSGRSKGDREMEGKERVNGWTGDVGS